MPSSHSRRGRIRPSQRDTNDAAPIIGEEFDELGTGYAARLHETAKQDKDENTRKDYRRRIIKICKFLEEHVPSTTNTEQDLWSNRSYPTLRATTLG